MIIKSKVMKMNKTERCPVCGHKIRVTHYIHGGIRIDCFGCSRSLHYFPISNGVNVVGVCSHAHSPAVLTDARIIGIIYPTMGDPELKPLKSAV
jgi:transcription elongation factor Elf1